MPRPPNNALIYDFCKQHQQLDSVAFVYDTTSFVQDANTSRYELRRQPGPVRTMEYTGIMAERIDYAADRCRDLWKEQFTGSETDEVAWEAWKKEHKEWNAPVLTTEILQTIS